MTDIKHVVTSIAKQYTDQSNSELHEDILISAGMEKLAQLVHKKKLETLKTRKDFFSFFKCSVNNYIKALVHRNIFTVKRSGQKPPPRHDPEYRSYKRDMKRRLRTLSEADKSAFFKFRKLSKSMTEAERTKEISALAIFSGMDPAATYKFMFESRIQDERPFESHKQVHVSIDDPEHDLHDKIESNADDLSELRETELYEDIKSTLNPIQKVVFDQMVRPNEEALFYATLEANRGKKIGSPLTVNVRYQDMAEGLGITMELFNEISDQIRTKIKEYMSDTEKDSVRFNTVVNLLVDYFKFQLPQSIIRDQAKRTIVRRALTIAARQNNTKVTDEISKMLCEVGAHPPEQCGNSNATLSCFGVLFHKDDKTCQACGLNKSCMMEVYNHGLSGIKLAPGLFPVSKVTRTASIIPHAIVAKINDDSPEAVPVQHSTTLVPSSERDDEILTYVQENFKVVSNDGSFYFRHKDMEKVKFIFWLGSNPGQALKLRFCHPSPKLKPSLTMVKNGAYLPSDVTVQEAIALIDTHAKETFPLKCRRDQ